MPPAAMALPAVLNECQKTMTAEVHRRYARMLAPRRREAPQELLAELLGFLKHALVVPKREPAVERLVRFVVTLATEPDAEDEEEEAVFLEELLWQLCPLAGAADKAVRFRACQLVASLLDKATVALSVENFAELSAAMTERLRDRAPAVRAQAARALARLQDAGDAGDFSEDAGTVALLQVLQCDKHKDVRAAVLASVAVSPFTVPALVDRTRDVADDVRRAAFNTVAAKMPLGTLSIAARATLLRRGLTDRAPGVRGAALVMLGKWMEACDGDVVRLLRALDVETHESVAELLLTQLIESGVLKPVDIATRDAATGLRRTEEDGLLSPELALYWRVVCEALSDDASALGSGAARGGGQAAAVAAASASEKLEALEAALPDTMVAVCDLVRRHTAGGGGARFASRQLLRLAARLDLSDAAASRAAGALAAELLAAPPAPGSYGAGGRGDWERSLVAFAVAALGGAAPDAVYAAAASLAGGAGADEAHWVQALGVTVPLLEGAASSRAAGGAAALRGVRNALVLPAVQHAAAAVRREGVRALGLLAMLEPPAAASLALLRGAAACDARPVRTHAARALCDLALLHGPAALDAALPPLPSDAGEAAAAAAAPLVPSLLAWLLVPAAGLAAPAGGAAEEEEEELRTVAAEGLAKLLLLGGLVAGEEDALAARALAALLAAHADADAHAHPRLAQCLTVFFPTFAAAGAAHKRRLALAAPLALREAARRKALPRLAAFLVQLLATPAGAPGDAAADAGGEALAATALAEALFVQRRYGRAAAVKPYLAALLRVAAAAPVRAPEAMAAGGGAPAVAAQSATVRSLLAAAALARERFTDAPQLKELAALAARLAALPGLLPAEEAPEQVLLDVVTKAESLLPLDAAFPFAEPATAPAAPRPVRASRASAAAKISAVVAEERAPRARRAAVAPMAALSDSGSDAAASDDDSDSDASLSDSGSDDEADGAEAEAPRQQAPAAGKQVAAARVPLADNVR